MAAFTFVVDVAEEIHDCAWIQVLEQLIYLPMGLVRHILIDGTDAVFALAEVDVEPICKVGLLQGVQELRPCFEVVVYEDSGPFTDVFIRCAAGPCVEHLKGLIYICLCQEGGVETQTAEKLVVGVPPCSYRQGSQGNRHTRWGEEDILALGVGMSC